MNKLVNQFTGGFLVLLVLAACGSANSPKNAADRFLNAFNEKNYAEARKYATPETIKLVDLMENLSKMSASADTTVHSEIEVLDEHIDGDTAVVTFREKGSEEREEIKLKKIDGKWLVHITKTDLSAKEDSVFSSEEEGVMMEPDTSGIFSEDSLETVQSE